MTKAPQRDTGLHHLDPDWTSGRGIALAQAEAIARAQVKLATTKVWMIKEPQE